MTIEEKYKSQLEGQEKISYQELQALSAFMKLQAEEKKANLEHEAALAKVKSDELRALYERKAQLERELREIEERERNEKRDIFKGMLAFLGTVGTVGLTAWRTINSNRMMDRMMKFEETGTWTTQETKEMAKSYTRDFNR